MRKAIISGSTGLVGVAVSNYLASKNVDILCLGRKPLTKLQIKETFGYPINYMVLPMQKINNLHKEIRKFKCKVNDNCVFFNFAWSGQNNLTDGTFDDQLKNVTYTTNAIKEAKKLGCVKFVNAGSLEETFAENYLKNKKNITFVSNQKNYTLAKLTNRNMCKIVSYLEKIDYIHTRISLPLSPNLNKGTYVANTLKKILKGETIEPPTNNRLFDIIFTEDVAKAYYLIGNYGKNNSDYFIGTSKPIRLEEYFSKFKKNISIKKKNFFRKKLSNSDLNIFSIKKLKNDTGFNPTTDCFKIKIDNNCR
ncbi:MAG: hypothetical protein CMF96_10655 [Candidatus Marinimicrobia bacterium]|nr:hypothetical protein [Candidatus Neomarinimicrobiota bacterium]